MREERIEKILNFWFGELADESVFPEEKAKMWFQEGEKADEFIQTQFGRDLNLAIQGKLDGWQETPRGLLALVIVLDQFSRNIYRDKSESFTQDKTSQALTISGIEEGKDQLLKPIERLFLYMPFMHAESRELQKKSIELFTKLADSAPPAIEIPLRNSLDFAERHAKIINRFGRYPYRNEVLERASTPEEIEFLKTPDTWFK